MTHDRERRIKAGEIREDSGFVIVSPYGGLWTDDIFQSVGEATKYLKRNHPGGDASKFKITEIYRPLGDAIFAAPSNNRLGDTMIVYVVMKDSKGGDGRQVWVFSNHDDALRCRREQKLDSHHLWGCTTDCYVFKDESR